MPRFCKCDRCGKMLSSYETCEGHIDLPEMIPMNLIYANSDFDLCIDCCKDLFVNWMNIRRTRNETVQA